MIKKVVDKVIKDTIKEEFGKTLDTLIKEEIIVILQELLKTDIGELVKETAKELLEKKELKDRVNSIFVNRIDGLLEDAFENLDFSEDIDKALIQNSKEYITTVLNRPQVENQILKNVSDSILDSDNMEEFINDDDIQELFQNKMRELITTFFKKNG